MARTITSHVNAAFDRRGYIANVSRSRLTPVSWRVNYKSLDFKSVLVSIPFLAVVAMLLRRSRRREVGGLYLAMAGETQHPSGNGPCREVGLPKLRDVCVYKCIIKQCSLQSDKFSAAAPRCNLPTWS